MKKKEYNNSKSLRRNIDRFMNIILDIIENDKHKSHRRSLVNDIKNNKEIVDPITRIFDEGDKIIIVMELPGIEKESINLEIDGNNLNVTAKGPEKHYYKKITLKYNLTIKNISANYFLISILYIEL